VTQFYHCILFADTKLNSQKQWESSSRTWASHWAWFLAPQTKQIKNVTFFFLVVLGSELRASHLLGRWSITWATPSALFCDGFFQDRVWRTICLGWLQTETLLISTSWVPKITGVIHRYPVSLYFYVTGSTGLYTPASLEHWRMPCATALW
jgi:hypothetical protein